MYFSFSVHGKPRVRLIVPSHSAWNYLLPNKPSDCLLSEASLGIAMREIFASKSLLCLYLISTTTIFAKEIEISNERALTFF
jgi:hypothetical protein